MVLSGRHVAPQLRATRATHGKKRKNGPRLVRVFSPLSERGVPEQASVVRAGDWELSYKLLSDPSKVDAERSQRLVELAVARRLADIQTTPAAGPPGTDFYKRLGLETCASYAAKASQQADPASAVLCHLLGCQMEEVRGALLR